MSFFFMLDRSIYIALKAERHIKSNHISLKHESKGEESTQTSALRKWLKCCQSYRLYTAGLLVWHLQAECLNSWTTAGELQTELNLPQQTSRTM